MRDAFYYFHYSDEHQSPTATEIIMKMGWAGYGIWHAVQEVLRTKDKMSWSGSPNALAFLIRCEAESILMLIEIGALSKGDSGIFCPLLNEKMEACEERRRQKSDLAKASVAKRWEAAKAPKPEKPARDKAPQASADELVEWEYSRLQATWQDWIEHRRQKKFPLSEMVLSKHIDLLLKYPPVVAIHIINKSIGSGWQGLFDLKKQEADSIDFAERTNEDENWHNINALAKLSKDNRRPRTAKSTDK